VRAHHLSFADRETAPRDDDVGASRTRQWRARGGEWRLATALGLAAPTGSWVLAVSVDGLVCAQESGTFTDDAAARVGDALLAGS